MTKFAAFLIDFFVAHSVDVSHVLPPLADLLFFLELVKQTLLPQVLHYDVFTLNVGALVVHCAVTTVAHTLFALEVGVATWTRPCH